MNGFAVQILATVILSMQNFFLGFNIAWTSYATITLSANDTGTAILGRPFTTYESGLASSLPMLGSLPCTLFAGYLAGAAGRRKSEIFSALIGVVSLTLVARASSVPLLLTGRLLSGVTGGIHIVIAFVYVSEICQESIRGSMAALLVFAYCFGMLLSYICGWVFTLPVVNYMFLAFIVLVTILLCFLKESPVYLLSLNRDKEALSSLKFYRRTSHGSLAKELAYLKSQRLLKDEDAKDSLLPDKVPVKESNKFHILRNSKSTQRAIVTILSFIFLSIFMGAIAVQAYAGAFFLKAAPSVSRHLCSVILAIAVTIGSAIATVLTDRIGRRILMITSCVSCTTCLFLLASLLRWNWAPNWVTAATCLVFAFVYHLGAYSIPMVQLSESFGPEMKAFASAVAMFGLCFGKFLVLSFYQIIAIETFGMDGTFLFFAIVSSVNTALAYLIMKETKGVSFERISAMYERGYLYSNKS